MRSIPRGHAWALGAVLVVAAALRFWNLGHGLPFDPGSDEPRVLEPAIRMLKTGDFNPHLFIYPTLYTYVQLVVAIVRFLLGATTSGWNSLAVVDSSDFHLWARATTALLGTATVWLVYGIGRRWDAHTALFAAALMAVLPMHVRESHYVLTDVPMAFLTTLTAWLSLRATERGTLGSFAAAAAVAGLAASTKYNGAVAVVMPLLAAHMTSGASNMWWKRDLIVISACAAGFVAGTPYAVLDLPKFLDDYASLASHHTDHRAGLEAPWLTYVKHLRLTLGWPALIAAGLGIVLTMARVVSAPTRLRSMLLLAFPALTFYLIAAKGSLPYGRYLIPILPFVCVMVAVAVMWLWRRVSPSHLSPAARTALGALGVLAVFVPPVLTAVRFDRGLTRSSTRAAAYSWVRNNLPDGARVVVETDALRLPDARYRVLYVPSLSDRSLVQYQKDRAQYLIASVLPDELSVPASATDQEAADRARELFDNARLLVAIRPDQARSGAEIRIFTFDR